MIPISDIIYVLLRFDQIGISGVYFEIDVTGSGQFYVEGWGALIEWNGEGELAKIVTNVDEHIKAIENNKYWMEYVEEMKDELQNLHGD